MASSLYHLVLYTIIKWTCFVGMIVCVIIFLSWCLNILGYWGKPADIPIWSLPLPLLCVPL